MRLSRSSGEAKTVPRVAADIAQRLLEAGRADEAWSAINAVDEKDLVGFRSNGSRYALK